MAERFKALDLRSSPFRWAWVRIPHLTKNIFAVGFLIIIFVLSNNESYFVLSLKMTHLLKHIATGKYKRANTTFIGCVILVLDCCARNFKMTSHDVAVFLITAPLLRSLNIIGLELNKLTLSRFLVTIKLKIRLVYC